MFSSTLKDLLPTSVPATPANSQVPTSPFEQPKPQIPVVAKPLIQSIATSATKTTEKTTKRKKKEVKEADGTEKVPKKRGRKKADPAAALDPAAIEAEKEKKRKAVAFMLEPIGDPKKRKEDGKDEMSDEKEDADKDDEEDEELLGFDEDEVNSITENSKIR
jgi:hypothetical protein